MAKNGSAEQLQVGSATPEPRIVPIYWDAHFRKVPTDVAALDEFMRTLFRSSWMSELSSYGLLPPRLLRASLPKDEPPLTLSRSALEAKLVEWLANGTVAPKPKRADRSLIFLVMTPAGTKLTPREARKPSSSYHASACFERDGVTRSATSEDHNLIYAVVPLRSTNGDILETHSLSLSQALTRVLVRSVRKH